VAKYKRAAVAMLLMMTTAACGTSPAPATPSQSTSASAASSPTSTRSSVQSVAPDVSSETYLSVSLQSRQIRSVDLPSGVTFHVTDSDGPRFVMDEALGGDKTGRIGTTLWFVDLSTRTLRRLVDLSDGYVPFYPAIRGDYVAWSELRSADPSYTPPYNWRIKVMDLRTSKTRLLATGVTGVFPTVAIDGDVVLWTYQALGHQDRTELVRASASTGAILESRQLDGDVFRMAADGGYLAYTAGITAPNGVLAAAKLYVCRPGSTKATEIASNAHEVSFRNGVLAWGQDQPTDVPVALPSDTRIWSASTPDLRPEPVAPAPGGNGEHLQQWPVSGDRYVTWGSERTATGLDQLAIWSPATRHAYLVEPTTGVIGSSTAAGWLIWAEELPRPVVKGLPLSEIVWSP